MWGATNHLDLYCLSWLFQSTHVLWRAKYGVAYKLVVFKAYFNPRTRVECDFTFAEADGLLDYISIRARSVTCDINDKSWRKARNISIHAPLTVRYVCAKRTSAVSSISIRAPLARCDSYQLRFHIHADYFDPHTCRGATLYFGPHTQVGWRWLMISK